MTWRVIVSLKWVKFAIFLGFSGRSRLSAGSQCRVMQPSDIFAMWWTFTPVILLWVNSALYYHWVLLSYLCCDCVWLCLSMSALLWVRVFGTVVCQTIHDQRAASHKYIRTRSRRTGCCLRAESLTKHTREQGIIEGWPATIGRIQGKALWNL